MPVQTLTPGEEQQLVAGVKQAVDYIDNQGLSPNEAIVKVARDEGWSKGFVRAAVSAHNNGRQLAQWKGSDNVLDKLASFPLADYDEIVDEIWGGSVKEAEDAYQTPTTVHTDYSLPPESIIPDREREKLAHLDLGTLLPETPDFVPDRDHQEQLDKEAADRRMRLAWEEHQRTKQAHEYARGQHAHAKDVVGIRLKLLENYFRKMAMDRMAFDVFDNAVATYYGDAGRAIADHLATRFPREKRAADTGRYYDPVNLDEAPFTVVRTAIKAAEAYHQTKADLNEAAANMLKAAEDLRPFWQAPAESTADRTPSPSLIPDGEKQANLGMVGASVAGAGARSLLADKGPSPVDKDWIDLEDPDHDEELRAIQTQAMLGGMMSDPDNPISGYDPEQVLNAYNDVAQLAPRAAAQPAALQSLLAKQLAGQMEPFEIQQITDLEKGLKDTKAQTPNTARLMNDAPESLLG